MVRLKLVYRDGAYYVDKYGDQDGVYVKADYLDRLFEYSRHKPDCNLAYWFRTKYTPTFCNCGYDELVKEIQDVSE